MKELFLKLNISIFILSITNTYTKNKLTIANNYALLIKKQISKSISTFN